MRGGLSILGIGIGLLVALAGRAAEASGPMEERATVVLLHGLGRSASNLRILEWRLRARGYAVCNLDYDTRVARIEGAAEHVAGELARCRARPGPLHFVTHSLGGLVLRALFEQGGVVGAGRAVMLAPPNGGSEIADRLRDLGLAELVLGPLVRQLGTGESDLPRRLASLPIPFGVIAGDHWINPAGPLWLPGPHDGTVSVESTRLEGMRDHIVVPYTHTFIMNAEPVAAQIDAFLRHGRFERSGGGTGG